MVLVVMWNTGTISLNMAFHPEAARNVTLVSLGTIRLSLCSYLSIS